MTTEKISQEESEDERNSNRDWGGGSGGRQTGEVVSKRSGKEKMRKRQVCYKFYG